MPKDVPVLDNILPVMTTIMNKSLASGVVPESMKTALVTPNLKKPSADPEIFQNYRPLSMKPFVYSVVKSGYFNLRNIALARRQLSKSATRSITQALVVSRLDYGNSLLYGITNQLMNKLQMLQNNAARLVAKTPKRAHITPVLRELHWLHVRARIDLKIWYLTFMALNEEAPLYLAELVHRYIPPRSLRSQNKYLLAEPSFHSTNFGGRAFSVMAPRLWNNLIAKQEAPIYPSSKTDLKK
ncbi:uncharacterized protein [Apostichopus japonicus]|uniref:uncharacterized protein n=1 Tax=Stichopus japonicus TaxID=307972 RepID=UPI003AB163E4